MVDMGKRAPLTNLYLAAAALGVVAVIIRFVLPVAGSATQIVGYILDILIGVVVVLIAIQAKRTMDRPALRASLAGLIYSLIASIGNLLFPPSAAALRKALLQQGSNLSQTQVNAAVSLTTSLGMRLFELVVASLFGWLLALLVGWIATLLAGSGDRKAI